MGHEYCLKDDRWKAQDERDKGFQDTLGEIKGHLSVQTELLQSVVRQDEKLKGLIEVQLQHTRSIENIFKRTRDIEVAMKSKVDIAPLYRIIGVGSAIIAIISTLVGIAISFFDGKIHP